MTDSYLNFPKQVTDLVNQALQNRTGFAALRPYVVDSRRNSPYDRSEFFQLRVLCAQQLAESVVKTAGLDSKYTGLVCDKVLVTAAEQMRKGVPLSDPTHLLAPYDLAQRNRGYGPTDGSADDNAYKGAKFGAELNQRKFIGLDNSDISADDRPIPMNLMEHITPASLPKNPAPADKMVYLSLKGGAKDAAFSYAAAFNHYNGGGAPRQALGQIETWDPRLAQDSQACHVRNTTATRSECVANGYRVASRERRSRD